MSLKKFFIFCALITECLSQASGQHFEKAADYHNFITEEQNKLLRKIMDYNLFITYHSNLTEINQKRMDILDQVNFSIERLKALESFKGDSKLKESSIEVYLLYKQCYDIEFNEVNNLRNLRENSFEDMERYNKALELAEEKLKTAGDKFYKAQTEFSKKHAITIKTSDVQNQLEDQWKLNKHIRLVYLEFFRVFKSDDLFMSAMNNQDVEGMEKRRIEIIKNAEISLSSLKNIASFKKDTSFLSLTSSLIEYHKNLAENDYVKLVKIIAKGDTMTNQDIDEFNEIATRVNTKSQALLSQFNSEKKAIMKRHVSLE